MKFSIILLIVILLIFNVELNDCRSLVNGTASKQHQLKRDRLLRKHIASKKYKKKYAAKNSDSSYKP